MKTSSHRVCSTSGNKLPAALQTASGDTHSNHRSFREEVSRQQISLKFVEFHLAARDATRVQLAADFTEWEKFPLDLIKAEGGVWFLLVPLAPGRYPYFFLVDGERVTDPNPLRSAAPAASSEVEVR